MTPSKIKKILQIIVTPILICSATSLAMCSNNNSVTDTDFLNYLEKLESPTYKYAHIEGYSKYENVKSYPEKLESEKINKDKEIKGKYEIKNKYETVECDDSPASYNAFLINARGVYSWQEDMFGGFENLSSVIKHFFGNNRTLKKDPTRIIFKFKGYALGINYVDDIDSDYGYYDIYGSYIFDEYGYPVSIVVSLDYIGYMQRPDDGKHRIYTSGRLRYNQNVSYRLSLNIVWGDE